MLRFMTLYGFEAKVTGLTMADAEIEGGNKRIKDAIRWLDSASKPQAYRTWDLGCQLEDYLPRKMAQLVLEHTVGTYPVVH